ncbi:dihydrolipoyl dehydrogenase family protein [Pelagibacterium lacus]|uniref:NAD(P)/FAD-dependent oxidoreductase n=1 Tax=Pelagibacterium lacus TaxID=2282655 RepID=A0A369W606_9HYPH|nr:NAD(P)/FAD-dependent oxidoreductase [Pelagibacterium lacus]RDE08692.1 NAD(P)/FAD-dependent oxidoreductase [Pelagibacterium lacus]
MAEQHRIDLVVIGAGPAGLAAAERGVELGARVALIEAGELGGVAHNWGTLPAQALAATAERAHQMREAGALGLAAADPKVNFARVNARIRQVVEAASPDIARERLEAAGIEVIAGTARFTGPMTLAVGERTLRAQNILIATGSRPLVPDIPGLDAIDYFTPETLIEITRRPGHLLVVGGGATGLALAQAHLRLGAAVTVVDMLEPLGDHDPELAEAVLRRLRAEGMDIRANTGIVSLEQHDEGLEVALKSGPEEERIAVSHIVFATGRRPALDGLGLDRLRLRLEDGRPVLRPDGRTSHPRIAMAGEAAGVRGEAAARHGAERAVAALLRRDGPDAPVPRMVQTRPALIEIGLSEQEALKAFKGDAIVTRTGFAATDAARARAEPHGHIKLITRGDGRIVGAGMVGPEVGELAPLFGLAIALKLTPETLGSAIAPHPSFSQAIAQLAREYRRRHGRERGPGWRAAVKRLLP